MARIPRESHLPELTRWLAVVCQDRPISIRSIARRAAKLIFERMLCVKSLASEGGGEAGPPTT